MIYINNALPIKITVLKKLYLNNYLLKIGRHEIKTKSKVPLEEGCEYLVEIYQENAMVFKNLQKVFTFNCLNDGYDLFLKTMENESYFKDYVIQNLLNSKSKDEYEFYRQMLFAYSNGIYQIPMIYEKKPLFLEIKSSANKCEVYVYFDIFGKLYFVIQNGNIIKSMSEFLKICSLLRQDLPNIEHKNIDYKTYQVIQTFKG